MKKLFIYKNLFKVAGVVFGIFLPLFVYAQIAGQFNQTDWSGGVGPSLENQFNKSFNIDFSVPGQISLKQAENWFDPEWNYRKSVTVDFENNPQTVTEYQILVKDFDTSDLILNNKLKDNCEDLRFTNAIGDLLDFVVIAGTCNTTDTQVWVKVDEIIGGQLNTIYIYYGNSKADTVESMSDTFSYSELKTVGFVIDPIMDQNGLNIVSLEADNQIQIDDDQPIDLGFQSLLTLNDNEIELGSVIKAKKLIHADGFGDAVDMLAPISFAGTEFFHYAYRYGNYYTLFSHWGGAKYQIYRDGVVFSQGTLNQGATVTINAIPEGSAVMIVSNIPIYVHHYAHKPGIFADSKILYPTTSEDLYGIPSANFLLSSGRHPLDISWIDNNGVQDDQFLNANTVFFENTGGLQGNAGAYRFQADGPFAVYQLADSDGYESTTFWPRKEMGTRFGANSVVQYVSMATPSPRVSCTPINNTGNKAGGTVVGGNSNFVNFIQFGFSDQNNPSQKWLNPGWLIECSKPMFAYYEAEDVVGNADLSDEHNLWSYPQMRQFIYPSPSVTEIGIEESRFLGSGTLVSNIIDIDSEEVSWGILELEGQILEVFTEVRMSSGNEADLSDALPFSNCDIITQGEDLTDTNCVQDNHRYIQYQIVLNAKGLNSPIFENLSINYSLPEPEPDPEPNPDPDPEPEPNPDPDPDNNENSNPGSGDQDFSLSALAGNDEISLVAKPVPLFGQAISNSNLTYQWSIVDGDGYLIHENTLNATYFSDDDTVSQVITIRFTVTDENQNSSSDELQINLINPNEVISGEFSGVLVANDESHVIFDYDNKTLSSENLKILFPESFEESNDFNLHLTNDNRLVIGFPNYNKNEGRVYISRSSIDDLDSTIDLEIIANDDGDLFYYLEGLQPGDQFGAYVTSADINTDNEIEVLVSSPHSGASGFITAIDPQASVSNFILGDGDFFVDSILAKFNPDVENYLIAVGPDYLGLNQELQYQEDFFNNSSQEIAILKTDNLEDHFTISSPHEEESIISMTMGNLDIFPQLDLVLTTDAGLVYIFYNLSPNEVDLSLSDASVILEAPTDDEAFGTIVQMGRVNGDNWTDLIFGAPTSGEENQGAVYILFGGPGFFNSGKLASHNQLLKIQHDDPQAQIGTDIVLVYNDKKDHQDVYTINAYREIISFGLPLVLNADAGSSTSSDQTNNESNSSQAQFDPTFGGGGSCQLSPNAQSTPIIPVFLSIFLFSLIIQKSRLKYLTI